MVPKFIRRAVYKKLIERGEKKEIHLCREIKTIFPYLKIYHYPELWNRRENLGKCLTPFVLHKERMKYLKEALNLIL